MSAALPPLGSAFGRLYTHRRIDASWDCRICASKLMGLRGAVICMFCDARPRPRPTP